MPYYKPTKGSYQLEYFAHAGDGLVVPTLNENTTLRTARHFAALCDEYGLPWRILDHEGSVVESGEVEIKIGGER